MLNIRELRTRAGLTQEDIAAALGVTAAAVCQYESGKRRIAVSQLMPLKDALGCTWEELFDETEATDGQADDAR